MMSPARFVSIRVPLPFSSSGFTREAAGPLPLDAGLFFTDTIRIVKRLYRMTLDAQDRMCILIVCVVVS